MSQDVLLSVMNYVTLNGESVNVVLQRSESCEKCFNLDAEFSKTQQAYSDLLKNYSQLEKHCISLELSIQLNQEIFLKDKSCDNQNALEIPEYFENKDLKTQFQDKDTTICKLKEIIKSMKENNKEEIFNYDKSEFETINVELENSVAKLLSENEHLCKEINHVKHVFKDQFDSIKKTRIHTKEHSDSLIDKLKLKSVENEDLKAQIQDKVFVITSLKNDLRKLKGKEIVDNTCPNAIKLSAKKVVVTPINKVKKVRFSEPLISSSNIKQIKAYKQKKNDRILQTSSRNMKNKVESQPRKVNKKNRVVEHIRDANADVKHSLLNANSEIICATCNKCMFDGIHDMCLLDFVINVVQIVLWYLDSECSKHMIGNRSQFMNFVSKFMGTVRFGNDQIVRIMGYGDYELGNVTISRVYYVEGLGHNLFSVGQFCNADLEVAFRKNTCFIWNLEGVNLLLESRDTNFYIISLDDMLKTSLICLLSKASKTKSWLWHHRLSHLNFACALGKRKKSSHQPTTEDTNQEILYFLHMDLCGLMRVATINEKRTKDEAPEAIIKCIKNIQIRLNVTVRNVRTDNGTEFVN
ncbi:hypothetical protein Tco_1121844 [Tanacetum coccineum]|uniref:Retrovirus-related Pol polyprotein from transposon TNT 1-94-like beta-barrel domain-containing protein n=1 Tax=Tanacetum coccineum TaxID=301880 RepID=A0ABQ5J2L4_9ASTR